MDTGKKKEHKMRNLILGVSWSFSGFIHCNIKTININSQPSFFCHQLEKENIYVYNRKTNGIKVSSQKNPPHTWVRSNGNPKVSHNRNASCPLNIFPWTSWTVFLNFSIPYIHNHGQFSHCKNLVFSFPFCCFFFLKREIFYRDNCLYILYFPFHFCCFFFLKQDIFIEKCLKKEA